MRLANKDGRAFIVHNDTTGWDAERASGGRLSADPMDLVRDLAGVRSVVGDLAPADLEPYAVEQLGPPVPHPGSIIAIGLNYAAHAAESGFEAPTELPPVFAKFPSSITGAHGDIALPAGGSTDWEVEVVAVVGRDLRDADPGQVAEHLAGLTIGQDLSERARQLRGPAPQFGLAKSHDGFSPIGPWVVTLDEFTDWNDLELGCSIDGEVVQQGRTSSLIFSIPRALSELSRVITLRAGDLVFTGTPDGVGMGLTPPRFLASGEVLETWVEGIGRMRHVLR